MQAYIYEIFADRRKIGIVVARTPQRALLSARLATTRRTDSKMDENCDYGGLVLRELTGHPIAVGEWLPEEAAL